jgi:hypothetical protein
MFKMIIRAHTDMMLNPFFEPYENGEDENECYDDVDSEQVSGNQLYLSMF